MIGSALCDVVLKVKVQYINNNSHIRRAISQKNYLVPFNTLMKMVDSQIVIHGETYSIDEIPPPSSKIVQAARGSLLGSFNLAKFVQDLGLVGKCIRVAYNGVAGYTNLQIQVQRVGYKIAKLANHSSLTVHQFGHASQSVLGKLQGTYEYLVDGMPEMALATLAMVAEQAKDMADAAKKLGQEFEDARNDVIAALEETQKKKGSEKDRIEKLKDEQLKLDEQRSEAKKSQERAVQAEEEGRKMYYEAEMRENKAFEKKTKLVTQLTELFVSTAKNTVGAVAATVTLDLGKAKECLQSIGKDDALGYEAMMDAARKEKVTYYEDMKKQRQIQQELYEKMIQFTECIQRCSSDSGLAEAAVQALHNAITPLKYLSTVMMDANAFWEKMHQHCKHLAREDVKIQIENAVKHNLFAAFKTRAFKRSAIEFYSEWVAMNAVCGEHMMQIELTRGELYKFLQENPTTEEARKNVRTLGKSLEVEIKQASEQLDALDERDSLLIAALDVGGASN